jgi:hypothetical protein
LDDAKTACDSIPDCNGITVKRGSNQYDLRGESFVRPSGVQISWLVANTSKAKCHPPTFRNPLINYSPGTMVRLTELGVSEEKFFYAANTSTPITATTTTGNTSTPITADQFYTELLKHAQYYEAVSK